ncbi:MAG TPA: AraC family transcriptional regulator [Bacillota bacterium]|nr:AraC family transcriptional regulator [Bacillota bacterium]
MAYEERIPWIQNTPVGIRIRNIALVPAHMHENIVEIFFCLQGSVKFSYGFEEFILSPGEFVSVDKDAHYLSEGSEDNICVSFYFDLKWFRVKYPFITNLLFVCEGVKKNTKPYFTDSYKQMKGTLIALLHYFVNHENRGNGFQEAIVKEADQVIDMMVNYFDIVYFYNPDLSMKPELMERNRRMMGYLQEHSEEKITLETMAQDFNLSKAYISEFLRTFEVGFRKSLSYIRANKSERLLLATDLNITEISEACGFSDPKYYYNAFEEWYKCTPRQFRKMYRSKMNEKDSERDMDPGGIREPLNGMILNHYLELFLA